MGMTPSRKGAIRVNKKERQVDEEDEEEGDEEDVEVVEVNRPKEEVDVELICPQSYCSKTPKEMKIPKDEEDEEEEEEDEEENGLMEVEDESGPEDKDKDLLR